VRTYFNLVATMVLGGLWHGAAWTFVVWGSLHGLFLVIERLVETSAWSRGLPPSQRRKLARALLTFAGVCVAWVFFRAQSFGTALRLVRAMFGLGASGAEHVVGLARAGWVLFATFAMLATQWFMRERSLDWLWGRLSTPIRAAAVALMVILLVTSPGDDRAFIYFQF
jgi:alginate O-acetyltransferase complex protein AlgI